MPSKGVKYKMGFTAGALLLKEAEMLIGAIQNPEAYMSGAEKLEENVLTAKFESSKKRLKRELDHRFKYLNDAEFLEIFSGLDVQAKKLLLFYAAARYYNIIADFMLEVVRNKWMNMDVSISKEDFLSFLFLKADKHEELDLLSESTKDKAASVVIKMLKELGMVKDGKLQELEKSPEVLQLIIKNNDFWFLDAILLRPEDKREYL